MAQHVITGAKVLYEGYDFSADFQNINLTLSKDALPDTAVADDARTNAMGLANFAFQADGFAEHGTGLNETVINGNWGTANKIFTVLPETAAEGKIGYSSKGITPGYQLFGTVGEMAPFGLVGIGSGVAPMRGTVLATGAQVASGNGTASQLGAVGASEYLYSVLHCTAVSGTSTPTITVKVYSDTASNMSGKTERIGFTAKTAIGVQWATPVGGAINDTWWRVDWTITGTDPSLTIYCLVGIF